ncbi:hypothetical protein [Burkholderia orbicola]|uniref:hypothetical protein n=1 Tax=Burkholderia orbicola TaxID=2978683 RepID=UPI002FDFEDB0
MEPLEQAEQFKLIFVPEQSNSDRKVFQGNQWLLKSPKGSILGEFRNIKAVAYPDHHATKIVLDCDWICHGWRVIRGGAMSVDLQCVGVSLAKIDLNVGFAGCGNSHPNVSLQWNSESIFPQIDTIIVHFGAATWEGC